ncbi:MAG: hypothetical protein V7K21_20065 [Nostoc sp.]
MKLKTLLIAASAALFLAHSFTVPALATSNGSTQECPHRGGGRR